MGIGKLSITITWSSPVGGGLSVTTPNGKGIYRWNVGPSTNTAGGYMDVIDTVVTGTGPENIYWPNSGQNPPTGVYHICYEPYNIVSSATMSITVTIKRGTTILSTYTKSILLGFFTTNPCATYSVGYLGSFTYS